MSAPLYKGFSSVNRNGLKTNLTDIELVKQDIRNALLVQIRSVPGYPKYGSVIPLLPFELESTTGGISGVLIQNAKAQIAKDPRVTLTNITMTVNDGHALTLNITLNFVQFNITDNLVLEFSKAIR
jgi:phage baseplate assembly protein W